MADEDVWKIVVITKSGLFEWNVMPFGLKNTTSMFSRTMVELFKGLTDQFLNFFVDDVNIHNSD